MSLLRAFGLVIDSAFEVPGAVPSHAAPADIVIQAGEARLEDASAVSGPYRTHGDRVLFTAESVARYLLSATKRIVIEADSLASPDRVSALLIATALPALLWLRGNWVLHASAFVPPGGTGAIAITAPSGGGKSTVLAEAERRGAAVVADDTVRLSHSDALPHASGLSGGMFLHQANSGRRFHAVPPSLQCIDGAPLHALVLLDSSGDGPPRLSRLRGVDALEVLLAARHRPRVPMLACDSATHLAQSALLARQLGIYRLRTGKAEPAAIVDLLMQELYA